MDFVPAEITGDRNEQLVDLECNNRTSGIIHSKYKTLIGNIKKSENDKKPCHKS